MKVDSLTFRTGSVLTAVRYIKRTVQGLCCNTNALKESWQIRSLCSRHGLCWVWACFYC